MKVIISLIIIIIGSSLSHAQYIRVSSLGGMNTVVNDETNSLNLYDFGNNPAWLYMDASYSYLKLSPSFENTRGNYRRYYDYERKNKYDLGFTGVKTLGTKGTFLGYTTYSIDDRINVNRSLKYNTYAGEAFFMTDTTSGNIKYEGPKVGFIYSLEVLPKLHFGFSAGYRILKGLKSIYSSSETIFRDVDAEVGLAYQLSENANIGIKAAYLDSQESIEAKSTEGIDVEIFNYRGEKNAVKDRSSYIRGKIRKQGFSAGPQISIKASDNWDLAFKAAIRSSYTNVLLQRHQLEEFEDGYSSFDGYNAELRSRYELCDGLSFGASLLYENDESWSKHSSRNLKLWDWNTREQAAVIGFEYILPSKNILIGVEYQAGSMKADSSKYIDGTSNSIMSADNVFRTGTEFIILPDLSVRAGYNLIHNQFDLITGGRNVTTNLFSAGFEYKLTTITSVNIFFQYCSISPEKGNVKRNSFNLLTEIKLLSF